jgi:hypothetical protein
MSNAEDLRPISNRTLQDSSVTPSIAPAIAPREDARPPSALRRTIHVLRRAMPIVQRLLPMLEGNVAATVVNVLASQSVASTPSVNLAPVEESIAKLRAQNIELHARLDEQRQALKRLAESLEEIREAASRNAIEQQKILVSLKEAAERARIFTIAVLAPLVLSLLLTLALLFHWKGAR